MTATDELRALLDERGVEHYDGTESTLWGHGYRYAADEISGGYMQVRLFRITPAQAIEATLGRGVTGETSDGYHTFNELYHHRAVLFSVIVRMMPDSAWKSRMHHDGTMYDGMFIVGIDTPEGQATYHYDVDPYWDMFDCKELERAPEWDGHSPSQAIERIATLGRGECHDTHEDDGYFRCSECGGKMHGWTEDDDAIWFSKPRFCPNCGKRIVEVSE